MLLAHSSSDNDELWPQVELDRVQVLVHPVRPLFPTECFVLAHAVRRPTLGVPAVDLEVTKLCIGYELTVDEESSPDPRAQGEDKDNALMSPARSKAHFSETGHIRIVEHGEGALGVSLEHAAGIAADPLVRDVGGSAHAAVANHGRETTADLALPPEMVHDAADGLRYRLRRGQFIA